jgi:hypothetical protein
MSSKQIEAVTYSRHRQQNWNKPKDYSWTASNVVCTVSANEIFIACMSMAVGFMKSADGYMLTGIIGVGSNRNLMLARDGSWAGKYIPQCYMSYPFLLARNENADIVLCVDEASGLVKDGDGGHNFFAEEGQPAPEVAEIFSILLEQDKQRMTTQSLCALFEKYELLQPWKIQIKNGEEIREFEGLFNINEKKLNALDTEALAEMHKSGALLIAHAQLLSMQHLATLGKDAEARIARDSSSSKPPTPAAMQDFDDGSGIISFDKLFGAY